MLIAGMMHWSCINPPDFANVPKIDFIGMTKDTLHQGIFQEDSLLVIFSFEDGDGDLGREGDAVTNNVFFTDTRTGQVDNVFGIPFIPQQGSSNGIEGEIRIVLFSTCCLYSNGQDPCTASQQFPFDEVSYEIYITDRAGNKSNTITTNPITLICN
jgi:hypothetical protein